MTLAAILILVGRLIFGGFFLIAGVRNFRGFAERKNAVTNYGWKMPTALTAIGFAMQVLGGLALILGVWTGLGVLMLVVFLVAATALFHNLFLFAGTERDPHLYFTLVNITLAGGLLLVLADAL